MTNNHHQNALALTRAIYDANNAGKELFRPIKELFDQRQAMSKINMSFSSQWHGYFHSYRNSVKMSPAIPKPIFNSKNSPLRATSMNNHSLKHQLELLHMLQKYQIELQQALSGVSHAYEARISQLGSAGLNKEQYESLVKHALEPTQDKLKRLIQHIEGNDVVHTKRIISRTESYLSGIR